MGGLLTRSSAVQGDVKMKKDKRKRRLQQLEVSFEPDIYVIPDENEDSNIDFIHTHESWESQRMMNANDPPGAPSTYSTNQSDITWLSPVNSNHSFYPVNPLRMTPPYNLPFIPHQNQISDKTKTVVSEEGSSKKVQFSSSNQLQQQQTLAFKPLTNTQSWHESIDASAQSTGKSVPLSKRSSLPRTSISMPKISSARTPIEKPIYIGVDFQATLAERSQPNGKKHHRRNVEKTHSDGFNSSSNNHRVRSRTNHQHKHQTLTDSPKVNTETIVHKPSDSQRIVTNNKLIQNSEQSNEIKPVKPRHHHRQQQQQQQPSMNNEIKPLKNRENHRRHDQQRQSSPAIIQPLPRQIESKQSGTPVMRIPLSQLNHQQQRQPIVLSSATKITKVHRTPL